MAEKLNPNESVPSDQEVRSHTPSSFSRTFNPGLTPRDRADLEKLKTKMFADIVPKSDIATKGKFEAAFEVEGPSPAELLERPVLGDGKILMSSAQLKRINSLLDSPKVLYEVLGKLHQLQTYQQDASALYEELKQGKTTDPQDTQNLMRMGSLIRDIKQHELSYLRMLQQLMLQATSVAPHGAVQGDTLPGKEEGVSENEKTEENGLSDGEESEESEQDEVHELTEEEQQREIMALHEQKTLLLKLIEQQKQLKELESKQASLTSLRNEAEARLSEIQQPEGPKLNNEVTEPPMPSTEEVSSQPSPRMGREMQEEELDEELDEETKASLLKELQFLRERKDRLNTLLMELENHAQSDERETDEQPKGRTNTQPAMPRDSSSRKSFTPSGRQPSERSVGQHKVTWSAPPKDQHATSSRSKPFLSEPVTSHFVPSEVVDVLPPGVERKLQSLNQAKGKLEDVQKMISQAGLNDSSIVSTPEKYSWNNDVVGDKSESEDKGGPDDTLDEELEARILQQRDELQSLMRQKEELLQMREMLRQLQVKEDEEGVNDEEQEQVEDNTFAQIPPPPPSSAQQHQLYDQLVRKNKQLRLAQRKSNELDDQENSSVQYSWDVTAATWGGSTAHTMESEVMSMYSTEDFDTTKEMGSQQEEDGDDTLLPERFAGDHYPYQVQDRHFSNTRSGTTGEGAVIEDETTSRDTYTVNDVPVNVERHTPRHFDGIQRPSVNTSVVDQHTPRSAGKKRRLGNTEGDGWSQQEYEPEPVPYPQNPMLSVGHEASLNSSFNRWGGQMTNPVVPSEFQQLQRQLADSTTMCSELLRSQVQLIGLVSQRFGEPGNPYTPGGWQYTPYYNNPSVGYQPNRPTMSSLDQYMQQLQGYHGALQNAYNQFVVQQSITQPGSSNAYQSFGSESVNLPPPPPQPYTGIFNSPSKAYDVGPPNLFSATQTAKPFVSPKFDFGDASKDPLFDHRKGASHSSPRGRHPDRNQSTSTKKPSRVGDSSHFATQSSSQGPPATGGYAQIHGKSFESVPWNSKTKTKSSKPTPGAQSDTYASITERSRQLAMEEFKAESLGGVKRPANTQPASKVEDKENGEEDSESSLPCSLPGDVGAAKNKRTAKETELGSQDDTSSGPNYSLFDALRETIYSEVATLIANNESRPHFLIELFRELQLLTTDYLRQRALYGIQDLVTRFLTEESLEAEATGFNPMNYQSWLGSTTEQTASESVVTSEGLSEGEVPTTLESSKQTYDYSEPVESASSLSTPKGDENPFEQDNLGDTVIHFGDALKHVRKLDESLNEADSTLVATPHAQETNIAVDSQQLDNEIKAVMMHVIPILKDNLHQACTVELLMAIQQPVIALVMAIEKPQKEFVEVFQRQLETSVTATLAKYQGRVLRDCGEDLLVDLSEVLFNEVGFFRVLQDMKVDPKTLVESSQERQPKDTVQNNTVGVLASTMTAAIHEEEEALGKTRDDEMAVNCDFNQVLSTSVTNDEGQTPGTEVPTQPDPKTAESNDQQQPEVSTTEEPLVDGPPKDPPVDHSTTVKEEDSTTTEQPEDDPASLQQEGVHVDTVNLEPVEGSRSVESGSPQGRGVKRDHSHVSVDSSQTPEHGSDHGSFDTLESMSDLPSNEVLSSQPIEQAGISVKQEQISVQLTEEQKTVSGVTGILQSLAEVPELVGSDTPVEPASETVPEP